MGGQRAMPKRKLATGTGPDRRVRGSGAWGLLTAGKVPQDDDRGEPSPRVARRGPSRPSGRAPTASSLLFLQSSHWSQPQPGPEPPEVVPLTGHPPAGGGRELFHADRLPRFGTHFSTP